MIVLTAEGAAHALGPVFANYANAVQGDKTTTKKPAKLLDVQGGKVVWSQNSAPYMRLREFLTAICKCGYPDWPQIVQIPGKYIGGSRTIDRDNVTSAINEELARRIRDERHDAEFDPSEDMVWLGNNGDGFVRIDRKTEQEKASGDSDSEESHALDVFIGLGALHPRSDLDGHNLRGMHH